MRDLFRTGSDFAIGLILSAILFPGAPISLILLGVIGGVLPDVLQLAYTKIRREPLIALQKFHGWIHSQEKIRNVIGGISFQIIVVLIIKITISSAY